MKFLFPITFLLIAGALFFVIVDPLYKEVDTLRADVATYNTALTNANTLARTRDDLTARYDKLTDDEKNRLEHFLPNTVNNIKFILEIEQTANTHSMPLKDIKFDAQAPTEKDATPAKATVVSASDPNASKPYGIFPIEFSTEGNYDTFVAFLKDVEHNLRLVDIRSVSFAVPAPIVGKPGAGAIDPSIYKYDLKVETYWLK